MGAVPALASPDAADPIFAAIETHRLAEVARTKDLDKADLLPCDDAEKAFDDLVKAGWDRAWTLLDVHPTTPAGIAALIRYADAYEDEVGWPDGWFRAALKAIAGGCDAVGNAS